MTLICSIFAAIACTVVWYASEKARRMKTGTLCLILWGASIMWLIDFIMGFAAENAGYLNLLTEDAQFDTMVGLSTVALGAVIWLIILLITDPCGVIKSLFKKGK